MPPIIFVQLAIQNTVSKVMGSLESQPLVPLAWEKIVFPSRPTVAVTKPGILFLSDVASSMVFRMLAVVVSESVCAMVQCEDRSSDVKRSNNSAHTIALYDHLDLPNWRAQTPSEDTFRPLSAPRKALRRHPSLRGIRWITSDAG